MKGFDPLQIIYIYIYMKLEFTSHHVTVMKMIVMCGVSR